MKPITTCLWFDTESEEAATLYTSLIENSRILDITHYGEAGPRAAGTVMTVGFELNGQEYVALNGGPGRTFNESISLQVPCEDQAEVDRLWDGLIAEEARKASADGSRTSSESPGRSSRPSSVSCSEIPTRRSPTERCKRCSG